MRKLLKCYILLCFAWLFAFTYLFSNVYAKSYIISPLPLPQQEILNISTEKCSQSCLLDHFNKGQLFSFVAFFEPYMDNVELRSKLSEVLGALGIMDMAIPSSLEGNAKIKLALLMPKKIIGRYSVSSIDTILAYLMARGSDFVFEIFDTGDESPAKLEATYKQIVENGYDFVIAILTSKGAQEFVKLDISLPTYLPTINKRHIQDTHFSKELTFGGIDYEAQIELLLTLAGDKPIITYNDNSFRGADLGAMVKAKSQNVILEEVIDSQSATMFSQKLEKHEELIDESVIFFNTPVMKTGLMASQLALSSSVPDKLLSTQINFDPSLLLLIQKDDRKNLFIANVIHNANAQLVEYVALLGGDLRYDWVNYATAIGVEQLILGRINLKARFFTEGIKDAQVEYVNRIYKSDAKKFYEYR